MTVTASNQIDLTADRRIVLRQRGHEFMLRLRPVMEIDWFKYFDAIVVTAEQHGREVSRSIDHGAAGLNLVESLLVGVVGYAASNDGVSIESIPGWQSKLPIGHRLAVLDTVLNVRAVEPPDDDPFIFDREVVYLEALWGADEDGNMRMVSGLKHVFATPSAEHYRSYMNQISRSKVVGGSRSGKTIYAGAQRVLCSIYDELIKDYEGYCVNGSPNFMSDKMDARHKVAAAERLFAAVEVEQ
jgi:hypothetical protein